MIVLERQRQRERAAFNLYGKAAASLVGRYGSCTKEGNKADYYDEAAIKL